MLNYYEILQISPSAPEEIIRAAYRAMAKLYHPDLTQFDKVFAEQRMKEINEAFSVLSDPTRRAAYDAYLAQQKRSRPSAGGQTEKEPPPKQKPDPDLETQAPPPAAEMASARPKSKLGQFVWAFGKSVSEDIQKNQQRRENAYLDGMNMDEWRLIQKFKRASGMERVGYCQALEERGLLIRNEEDRLVPNPDFRDVWNWR